MRVSVDRLACEANAVCAGLVPEVFSIVEDDAGDDVLAVADGGVVPGGFEEAVRGAVRRCPKLALSVVD